MITGTYDLGLEVASLLIAVLAAYMLKQRLAVQVKAQLLLRTLMALQKTTEELEIRVEERTRELKQAIGQLQGEIAERKQAEESLQQSSAQFRSIAQREELLNRLATQIRNSLDLDTILETTVQQIRELLQIDNCRFIWYVSELSQPAWEVVKEAKSAVIPRQIGDYAASAGDPLAALLLEGV
jgi:predicted RNase H-like nuclease (RuvC/YqgF family)